MMHGLIYRLTIGRTHEWKAKVVLCWRVKLNRNTRLRKQQVYCLIHGFIFFQRRRLPFVQLIVLLRTVKTSIVVA